MSTLEKTCNNFTPDKVRVRLEQYAIARKRITYGNLVEDINGVRGKGHVFQRYLRQAFIQIDREDRRCGRPCITAMVVRQDTCNPGMGFYVGKCDMAKMTEADLEEFSEQLQELVIAYYAKKDSDTSE